MKKTLEITGDLARQAGKRSLDEAPIGHFFKIYEPKRKEIQNDKFHAMIDDIAKVCLFMGKRWPADIWKRLLMAAYVKVARENARAEGKPDPFKGKGGVIPMLDGDGFLQLSVSTTELTVGQAAEFIEYLYAYGEANHVRWSEPGLYAPTLEAA
jgi:hypothetical protein